MQGPWRCLWSDHSHLIRMHLSKVIRDLTLLFLSAHRLQLTLPIVVAHATQVFRPVSRNPPSQAERGRLGNAYRYSHIHTIHIRRTETIHYLMLPYPSARDVNGLTIMALLCV